MTFKPIANRGMGKEMGLQIEPQELGAKLL